MRAEATALPSWIKPQLTKLVDAPPEGPEWLHEIKFDGYRMHTQLDQGAVRLLTRTGLDWTHKYPAIAAAFASFPARQAYLDGELCGVRSDGTTSFSLIQFAPLNLSDRCGSREDGVSRRPRAHAWMMSARPPSLTIAD
jgi:ATP-dependent DNA ligase